MISPDMRHSFLLSSNTVFMFSIQTASIGPSKMTHFRSGDSDEANARKVLAVIPSDHCGVYSVVKVESVCGGGGGGEGGC